MAVVHYFDSWGRAERIRWLLLLGGIEYTNKYYEGEEWESARENIEFGQLPVVVIDGFTLVQSLVIERYIARKLSMIPQDPYQEYLVDSIVACIDDYFRDWASFLVYTTNIEGFVEYFHSSLMKNFQYIEQRLEKNLNKNFAVGDYKTLADFAIAEFIHDIFLVGAHNAILSPLITEKCPKIVDFTRSFIANNQKLQDFLSARPAREY